MGELGFILRIGCEEMELPPHPEGLPGMARVFLGETPSIRPRSDREANLSRRLQTHEGVGPRIEATRLVLEGPKTCRLPLADREMNTETRHPQPSTQESPM